MDPSSGNKSLIVIQPNLTFKQDMYQEMKYDYNVFSLMYLRVNKKEKKRGKQKEKYAYLGCVWQ